MFRKAIACRAEKAMTLTPTGIARAPQSYLEPTFCLEFCRRGRITSDTLHGEVPCVHFESGQDLGWFGSSSAWNLSFTDGCVNWCFDFYWLMNVKPQREALGHECPHLKTESINCPLL